MDTQKLFLLGSRRFVFVLPIEAVSACSIQQQVTPVDRQLLAESEVCIIENPAVRPGFLVEVDKVSTTRIRDR
jgi:hypothetical protein